MKVELSVVIPVYRSGPMLPTLVDRLLGVLKRSGRRFEVILVDDGSPDDSWQVLCNLHRSNPECLILVQLMRNYGQHNALMCGFRHARGKYVVTMDDDLQNPPEEVPKLVAAIEETGLDLVYGTCDAKQHTRFRNVGSALAVKFFKFAFGSPVAATSFRIIRRELVESIFAYALNFTYIDGLLAWNTQRIGAVPVVHHARTSGASGYSLPKLFGMAFNLFTNFSLLPLKLVSACGLLAACGGLLLGAYFFIQQMISPASVPGYASTIVVILILGGIQLLSLGIMGEYIGRLHLNVSHKPQYVERQVMTGSIRSEQDEASRSLHPRPASRADNNLPGD